MHIDRKIGGTDAEMPQPEPPKASEQAQTNATPEPKFEPYKGKIRKPGTGCVTMINDHLYEEWFTPRFNGKRISKNVHAKTREEYEEKFAVLIVEMKAEIKAEKERKNRYQADNERRATMAVALQYLRCSRQIKGNLS